jgi:hypothetical protein
MLMSGEGSPNASLQSSPGLFVGAALRRVHLEGKILGLLKNGVK